MTRTIHLALALALSIGIAGCNGTDKVTGAPLGGVTQRTLAAMAPLITKSLTTTLAEEKFGFPDERTDVPPIVLTYYTENSSKVSLVFPDLTGTILTASHTDKSGVVTPLTIYP